MRTSLSKLNSTKIMPVVAMPDEFKGPTTEQNFCRICMDTNSPTNRLISPCRCRGSLRYIHEECLKTWLSTREGEITEMKCELCNSDFRMEFVVGNVCRPKQSFDEGFTQCLFVPLLIGVSALLLFVMALLIERFGESENDTSYSIVLIIICLVSVVFLLVLVVYSLKQSCISRELVQWNILNQYFHEEEENLSLPDLSLIPDVMVVPSTIQMAGQAVRTPVLTPSMTPVMRGDRAIAYTPVVNWAHQSNSLGSLNHEVSFLSNL